MSPASGQLAWRQRPRMFPDRRLLDCHDVMPGHLRVDGGASMRVRPGAPAQGDIGIPSDLCLRKNTATRWCANSAAMASAAVP
jgi:hypothetical protein